MAQKEKKKEADTTPQEEAGEKAKQETVTKPQETKVTSYKEAVKAKRKSFSSKKGMSSKFDQKKKQTKRRITQLLAEFMEKAGFEASPKALNKKIMLIDLYIMGGATAVLLLYFAFFATINWELIRLVITMWTVVLVALYGLSLLVVIIYFDMRIANRSRQIEDVLPDFLQLASANISAGMPIDKALWFAVRPRFGALAEEMEEIAKATFTGGELAEELTKFSRKYNSRLLKESINLIVVGLESGGEIGGLLNDVSENIQATKLMKKEIGASVTTYVIFITVASILAAPLLLALSSQLLDVVREVSGSLDMDESVTSSASLPFALDFSGESVSQEDFFKFALTLMIITSFFASLIVSVIAKGTARDGFAKIPLFFLVSFLTFLGARALLGLLLGGLI